MDQSCRDSTHVKQLVTARPDVKLSREESLGDSQHIESCPEDVGPAHHQHTPERVGFRRKGVAVSRENLNKRNQSIESEREKDGKAMWAIFRCLKPPPHADGDTYGTESEENRDVSVLGESGTVEAIVVGGDVGTGYEKCNTRVVQSAEYLRDALGMIGEKMEHCRTERARQHAHEKEHKHHLLRPGKTVYLDILKPVGDEISKSVNTND